MIIQKIELESLCWDDWTDNFVVADRGRWVVEGKYDYMRLIIYHTETQRYYQYCFTRSGSYFTEYYYGIDDEPDEIEIREVVPHKVTRTKWAVVT